MTAGTLDPVDGGTSHLKCMGSGPPSVILTAGAGGWAANGRKVQPQLAVTTRTGAWDRAGFGFSGGSTRVQTVSNTTTALQTALRKARIRGPYVLVGHSLGGYESLLFKDREPRRVVGMVLVDSSFPDQFRWFDRHAPLVVLSSTRTPPPSTPLTAAEIKQAATFRAQWRAEHAAYTALSTRGVHRLVPDAGHSIQLDQPQAVIDAVREVVKAARRTRRPWGVGGLGLVAGQ